MWLWNLTDDLEKLYSTSSTLHQALCIISNPSVNSNWLNLGHNQWFFVPCDLEILQMTLKNNRAPLLCYFKFCASYHSHWWIQTGVTVQKRLSWAMTSVTLTFDLWPWTFAWTSLLYLVIAPENFVMIQWQEHSEKVWQTDRGTDRQKEVFLELLGRS